jgi:MYXO-CTERM domain-containing protein
LTISFVGWAAEESNMDGRDERHADFRSLQKQGILRLIRHSSIHIDFVWWMRESCGFGSGLRSHSRPSLRENQMKWQVAGTASVPEPSAFVLAAVAAAAALRRRRVLIPIRTRSACARMTDRMSL